MVIDFHWYFVGIGLGVGFLAGFGLKVMVDYAELTAYRKFKAKFDPCHPINQ